jgi:hypothetical protein
MLTIPKSATCFSTANIDKKTGEINLPKKGNQGRQEVWIERTEDGFRLEFQDRGNYGRERWRAEFNDLSSEDVLSIIGVLEQLVDGATESTRIEFSQPEPEPEVEAPAEETEESVSDVPVEVLPESVESETEQLEA